MSWEESAVHWYHDVGQPAHDGGSILQEPSRVVLHQRPRRTFLDVGGLAGQTASTGRRTGSCCCSFNHNNNNNDNNNNSDNIKTNRQTG